MQENRFELFDVSMALISKCLQKIKSEKMVAYGLKASHVLFMVQLDQAEDGLTASELAKAGHMDKAQISRVIAELSSKGFIVKCDGRKAQKYKNRLRLTDTGKRIANELNAFIAEAFQYVSGSIPPADLEIFYRTLFTISDNLFSFAAMSDPRRTAG